MGDVSQSELDNYAIHVRLEEINNKLRTGNVVPPDGQRSVTFLFIGNSAHVVDHRLLLLNTTATVAVRTLVRSGTASVWKMSARASSTRQ
jgi:hypothetical protein